VRKNHKNQKASKKAKQKKRLRNAPLRIPLPFDQIVDAMLKTPPAHRKSDKK
jgi:hypothetical protein